VNARAAAALVGIVVVLSAGKGLAAPDAGCTSTGTSLYFGNGINTTYDEAWEDADDDLPGLAAEANVNDLVAVGVAYNHTDGLLADVIQTLEQKEEEDPRFGWYLLNNILGYLLRGLTVVGVLDLPTNATALIATLQTAINQGLADSNSHVGTFYDSDVADQVSGYEQDLTVNGYRVIVVAHSQGTLYANAARAALAAVDSANLGSFGIVAVGDAAEITFNGYVTSDHDLVINALRTLGRTVLPANIDVPATLGDFTGHFFEATYINAQLPARASVVALLATVAKGLIYPAIANSCGSPSGCAFNGGSATALYSGALAPGDTQAYPLQLTAGHGVGVRVAEVGTGTFTPAFSVYDPTGVRIVNGAYGANVASDFFAAQKTGTYVVVVYDDSTSSTSAGAYNVYLMVAPGADACGSLSPGMVVPGQLAEGAIDSYTFAAQAGEGVGLRVTDVAGGTFTPAFIVYDPTGAVVVDGAYGANVASDFFAAQKTGTYTVVVYDDSSGYASTGPYNLYFTLAPGANAGGALSPGVVVSSQLAEGAIDSYTFAAQAGEGVGLRVTDVAGGTFTPAFIVYDPTGAVVVDRAYGANVASDFFAAQKTGTYTVVVYDDSSGYASTGPYNLYFTLAPGADAGGTLSPGTSVSGQLAEGALDSYTFAAQVGEGVGLRVTDVAGGTFTPAFIVYDPTGAVVVDRAYGANVASDFFAAQKTGTYTVVVYDDSSGYASTGPYSVSFTLTTPSN
jgi:hypothetical protein